MRLFLKRFILFLLVPVLVLAVVYLVTDPYKTLRPFSLEYFDSTNRDYLSSELFLANYPEQQYDSYIFASSRGGGINTYHWAKYLPAGSKQFMFQAWAETIAGIEQKVAYIADHDYPLANALVLLDVPDVISHPQLPTQALSIKDPRISRQPRWVHQAILFYDFAQKPSQWSQAVSHWIHPTPPSVTFDPITNDWNRGNRDQDLSVPPAKDSLNNISSLSREVFLKEISTPKDPSELVSGPCIDAELESRLNHIKEMFTERGTDYRVVLTPGFYLSSLSVSPADLACLKSIFGENRVFDFSGKSEWNTDYNNFSDPTHFGLYVGWHMIEAIYGGGETGQ